MFTQLYKSIYQLAEKRAATVDYKVKQMRFVEKKSCRVTGCDTLSGTIKIVLVSDKHVDRDLVVSLQNPCVTHGFHKLVVENWCAISWLYADITTKKKICCRREFFQLSADSEIPVDNIIEDRKSVV